MTGEPGDRPEDPGDRPEDPGDRPEDPADRREDPGNRREDPADSGEDGARERRDGRPVARRGFLGAVGAASLGATGAVASGLGDGPTGDGGRGDREPDRAVAGAGAGRPAATTAGPDATGGSPGTGTESPGTTTAGATAGDPPTTTWTRTYGGEDDDVVRAAVPAGDGGLVLAGHSTSSGPGFRDGWALRLGPDGGERWRRTYGGAANDRFEAVARFGDGYLLAGTTRSAGPGLRDGWVVAVDPGGSPRFERTHGGIAHDRVRAVVPAGDGGYLLAGHRRSGAGGRRDTRLIRVRPDGTEAWARSYDRRLRDDARAVVAAPDGGFVFAGTVTRRGSGLLDARVAKVGPDGRRRFDRTLGGSGMDVARDLAATGDGYLVAGATDSGGDDGGPDAGAGGAPGGENVPAAGEDGGAGVAGGFDASLAKVGPDGSERWRRTYSGPGDDRALSVVPTGDGDYLLGGSTRPPDGDRDGWLARVDGNGRPVWARACGGEGRQAGVAAAPAGDGGALLAGGTDAGPAGVEAWVTKVGGDPPPRAGGPRASPGGIAVVVGAVLAAVAGVAAGLREGGDREADRR